MGAPFGRHAALRLFHLLIIFKATILYLLDYISLSLISKCGYREKKLNYSLKCTVCSCAHQNYFCQFTKLPHILDAKDEIGGVVE